MASCALSDFAFWSADVKAVQKVKVTGRITCCAWSLNGQYLAIGLASGVVSLRDKVSIRFFNLDININFGSPFLENQKGGYQFGMFFFLVALFT